MNNQSIDLSQLLGGTPTSDLLIDSVSMLVVVLDINANIQYINKQAIETLGYSLKNIQGQSWFNIIVHQSCQTEAQTEFLETLATSGTQKSEWKAVTRNGDHRTIAWRVTQINQNNKIVGVLYLGTDVTSIRRTEKALLESELRFQTIFDNINEAVFVHEPETGAIIDVNMRTCEMYGYSSKDQIKNLSVEDLSSGVEPYTKETAQKLIQRTLSGESPLVEWHAKHKSGELFWVEINMKLASFGCQKVILVTIRDITSRKITEEDLSRSQRLFQTLMENAPFGAHIYELTNHNQLIFTGANESASKILGIDCNQCIGKTIEDVFPSLAKTSIPERFRKVAVKGVPYNTVISDYRDERISGTFQIHSAQIGINRMVVFFTDITESKKAEQAIKESHERASAFAEATYEGIAILDQGRIVEANSQFAKMLRYNKPEELKGLSVEKLSPPETRELVANNIRNNKEEPYEALSYRKDGSIFPIEIRGRAFSYKGKKLRIAAIRDLTQRKRSDRELENKNNELEQIIFVTSHDLRSPLVNVQGYSKEISYMIDELKVYVDQCTSLTSEVKNKIDCILNTDIPESFYYINSSIAKMDSLLEGLLRLSRSGRVQLNPVTINANQLFTEVINTFEYQIENQGINVQVSDLPTCTGDLALLNQVASNLIDNAIKYRSPNRNCIITITGNKASGNVTYCIEDNGMGIAQEHNQKVFEIFYRLHPKEIRGEGLGLSIVRKILHRMHGDILLESTPGKGSRFIITLPE